MMKYLWAAALLFGLSLLGCSDKPSTYPVSGTVMFDGQPVTDGDIVFRDVEDKVGPDAGKIKDGQFTFRAKPGKKKVEIQANRLKKLPSGVTGPMGQTEVPLNYIPARYNTKTELTADVTADGANQYEFKMTSQ
jgi:hypothetical protein